MPTKNVTIDPAAVHIEGRVGRLEGAVENLTQEVQETSKSVREIANGLGSFKESVLSHIGAATAPKWPLIFSFVTLTLTILGLGIGLVSQSISGQSTAIAKNAAKLDQIESRELDLARQDSRNETWRETVDKKSDKLDTDLQREMRLVNETTDAKLQETIKSFTEQALRLQSQIDEIRMWKLKHVEDMSKFYGVATTQLGQLQHEVDRIEQYRHEMVQGIYDTGVTKAVVGGNKHPAE